MKYRKGVCVVLLSDLFSSISISLPVCARTETKLPLLVRKETPEEEAGDGDIRMDDDTVSEKDGSEEDTVLRNTVFTTSAQMQQMMGTEDTSGWSVLYLSEVEQAYWNFSPEGAQEDRELSLELVSNAYRNLEMFLDNGYLLDYQTLAEYAEDYLQRKGEADSYYRILTECLKNPYLLNKPRAEVTDTTYNGRDYSAVFDPEYYYDTNPDLQRSIGFQPPELLRHFVEKGVMEGRRGSAELDMDVYIAYTDGEIWLKQAGIQAPGVLPCVAKYSYSRANYYGKLLGHYAYPFLSEEEEIPAEEENTADW